MSTRRIGRLRLAGVVLLGCFALGLLGAGSALAETKTFSSAGCETWEVPPGVISLSATAAGGAGQTASGPEGGAGGHGDEVTATVGVAPGETFDVCVAQGPGKGGLEVGGTTGGGNGGGASGLARGKDFSVPLVVAGGGGGGGQWNHGLGSEPGGPGGAAGMKGGSTASSGSGGAVDGGSPSGSAGPGSGGTGAKAFGRTNSSGEFVSIGAGGGGGGGYVGGGGGKEGGGGAGGTDFCGGAGVTCSATNPGAGTTTGSVTITYTPLPTSKEQCKKGGWRNFGTMFKNQGQCVRFVETGKHAARRNLQRH